jgi:FlaA1/EpsC-like NDP-sugar epimerase
LNETRILVVGAGSAGAMAVREILAHPETGIRPVGFIDDDPAKAGSKVEGVPVLGGRSAIPHALRSTGAREILIALPSVHGAVIRETIETCRHERVRFRIVPGIWEIIRGDVHIDQIRKVEPEDLLGRETIEADTALLDAAYRGKRILVTGAGGSIGSELVRQVLPSRPARVVLLGRGENSLFESALGLSPADAGSWEHALVDLRHPDAVSRVFEAFRPHVVIHAAAHKHVGFMERFPEEAVHNNIVVTRDLLRIAETSGVKRFVMLSTDKAVHPQSVMGASKRVAELLLQEHAARSPKTILVTVRFGNVLGSRGSVVPVFQHQIRHGGPVTVSHPESARYFMTLKEAALLVLEAGAVGKGGETFILDMGEQIKIVDLARELITLSGLRPDEDVPIQMVGLGAGEKLREALVYDSEELVPTPIRKIGVARPGPAPVSVEDAVPGLEALARRADRDGIRRELMRLVPEASLGGDGEAGTAARARSGDAEAGA